MKKLKYTAAALAAAQLLALAAPVFPALAGSAAIAGKSHVNPGFSYGSKAEDYVEGQDY